MVVHNLNVEHVGTSEADPPLVIDPNTVLPFAITGKSFQARNLLEPPAELPREDLLGLLIAKGSESAHPAAAAIRDIVKYGVFAPERPPGTL